MTDPPSRTGDGDRDEAEERTLPPRVRAVPEGTLATYWRERERQHLRDTYAGLRIKKFPEDLRVMEHLMWLDRTQVVVELGTHLAGSCLWFRDRLRTLASYGRVPGDVRVVSVDLSQDRARALLRGADPRYAEHVTLVEGDVTDPATARRVAGHVPDGARCMVVEDTLHTYATTTAALENFSPLVGPGGFFVVEDGIVDSAELRPPDMPGGVVPAIRDWLATPRGRRFRVRRDLERYGVTCHPHGWLQRVGPDGG